MKKLEYFRRSLPYQCLVCKRWFKNFKAYSVHKNKKHPHVLYVGTTSLKKATHFEWDTSSCIGFTEGTVIGAGSNFGTYENDANFELMGPMEFAGVFPISELDEHKKKWGRIRYLIKI